MDARKRRCRILLATHCLMICVIQLWTLYNFGGTWRRTCSPDIWSVSALGFFFYVIALYKSTFTYLLTYLQRANQSPTGLSDIFTSQHVDRKMGNPISRRLQWRVETQLVEMPINNHYLSNTGGHQTTGNKVWLMKTAIHTAVVQFKLTVVTKPTHAEITVNHSITTWYETGRWKCQTWKCRNGKKHEKKSIEWVSEWAVS